MDIDAAAWDGGRLSSPNEPHARGTGDVSLIVHDANAAAGEEPFLTAFKTAPRCLPWAFSGAASDAEASEGGPRDSPARTVRRSVVEAAVTLPDGWLSRRAEEERSGNPMVTAALDSALDAIRALQHMAFQTAKKPIYGPSPETLPSLIPMAVGRRVGDVMEHLAGTGTAFVNAAGAQADHLRSEGVMGGSPPPQVELPRGPFTSYLSIRNEADVALYFNGQYRSALFLLAAACESLLDTALQMLLWESGMAPEDAAPKFNIGSGIEHWVKSNFANLVGGHWDGRPDSSVAAWRRLILYPRNVSAHSGIGVDRQVALDATWAADEIRLYLGARVFANQRRFPLTSLILSTSLLMAPREGMISTSLRVLSETPDESVPNLERFGRWRLCVLALGSDHFEPRSPSLSRGGLVAVVQPDQAVLWVWHDWISGRACLVELDNAPNEELETRLRSRGYMLTAEGFSFAYTDTLHAVSPWAEEHNLIPGLECLASGDDLDRFRSASRGDWPNSR